MSAEPRNCFTCRFRYKSLRPDEWGGYPWRCSAKGGIKIGSGQDRECPQGLWEPKKPAGVNDDRLQRKN